MKKNLFKFSPYGCTIFFHRMKYQNILYSAFLSLWGLGISSFLLIYKDITKGILPNKILMVLGLFLFFSPLKFYSSSFGLTWGFLIVFLWKFPQSLGMGDVKLLGLLGSFLPFDMLPFFFLNLSFLGLIFFIIALFLEKYMALKSPLHHGIPFGPSIVMGFWILFPYGIYQDILRPNEKTCIPQGTKEYP